MPNKKYHTEKQRREARKLMKQRYRAKYAIRDIWHHLRARAPARRHTCGISYEDFEEWCLQTGYHLMKGKTADSASIDRDKDHIGYEKGNLTVKSLSDNTTKENLRRKGIAWQDDKEFVMQAWRPMKNVENF